MMTSGALLFHNNSGGATGALKAASITHYNNACIACTAAGTHPTIASTAALASTRPAIAGAIATGTCQALTGIAMPAVLSAHQLLSQVAASAALTTHPTTKSHAVGTSNIAYSAVGTHPNPASIAIDRRAQPSK
jgi:hypothetical protein